MPTSPVTIAHAVAACLTTFALAAPAHAASAEERTPLNLGGEESARQAAGGGGGGIPRMIVGLAVVIGVIYGLSWVLRQVRAAREGQGSGDGLSSVSSLPLGPNRSLHLVRVGHELVLLGAAEKGLVPIRVYREDEAVEAGLAAPTALPALPAPTGPSPVPAGGGLVETLRARTVRR
jgi:flagellar protein FliO/FliZ